MSMVAQSKAPGTDRAIVTHDSKNSKPLSTDPAPRDSSVRFEGTGYRKFYHTDDATPTARQRFVMPVNPIAAPIAAAPLAMAGAAWMRSSGVTNLNSV